MRAMVEECGSTLKQHWVNATCLHKVYSRPSDGLVSGQLLDDWPALNQQWVATLAQHRTRIWWVGLHSLYEVHRRKVLNECWPAPGMVEEELHIKDIFNLSPWFMGGGPRVVVSTTAFHARVPGSVPGFGGLKETKMFLPHPRVKLSIVGSLRDQEVACAASDRQGSNFESCVWRTVSAHSSHHPQEVLLT